MKAKRRRKFHKKPYAAAKVKNSRGKMVYAACMRGADKKRQIYKLQDASFWADWRPRRDLGVYANCPSGSYKHNGAVVNGYHT
jgi:hypothetical protein